MSNTLFFVRPPSSMSFLATLTCLVVQLFCSNAFHCCTLTPSSQLCSLKFDKSPLPSSPCAWLLSILFTCCEHTTFMSTITPSSKPVPDSLVSKTTAPAGPRACSGSLWPHEALYRTSQESAAVSFHTAAIFLSSNHRSARGTPSALTLHILARSTALNLCTPVLLNCH